MRTAILILASSLLASSCANRISTGSPQATVCEPAASDLEAARQAFFFAFPLYEMSRMRQVMLSPDGARINSLRHRTMLSRPQDRSITTPNNDTLYSSAWLDLAGGPVRLSIPPMQRRYHSIELMDAFSDAFAILRNETEEERAFLIVGPGWKGEADPNEAVVRSPTRDAWLVARTHVKGTDDLSEALRVQSAYGLQATGEPVTNPDSAEQIPPQPDGRQFLAAVNTALERGPLPRVHAERLACFSKAGIAPVLAGTKSGIDAAMLQTWNDNISRFYAEAMHAFENSGTLKDGWRYPDPNIGDFGTDDIYRSAMALGGLAAMPIGEAINPMTNIDSQGERLTGASEYQLRIPADVPVDGFWSMTLYESDGAGRWFLYDNPFNRYAIGSTTPGLEKEKDGAVVVQISHREPPTRSNWLPAPEGDFRLVFRAYQPQAEWFEDRFYLPPVEKIVRDEL